jgi:hypothetical protein
MRRKKTTCPIFVGPASCFHKGSPCACAAEPERAILKEDEGKGLFGSKSLRKKAGAVRSGAPELWNSRAS